MLPRPTALPTAASMNPTLVAQLSLAMSSSAIPERVQPTHIKGATKPQPVFRTSDPRSGSLLSMRSTTVRSRWGAVGPVPDLQVPAEPRDGPGDGVDPPRPFSPSSGSDIGVSRRADRTGRRDSTPLSRTRFDARVIVLRRCSSWMAPLDTARVCSITTSHQGRISSVNSANARSPSVLDAKCAEGSLRQTAEM